MEYLAGVLIIMVVIILIAYLRNSNGTVNPINKLQELKQAYEKALIGNNKRAALNTGRIYYSELREDKTLTVYDEQAIANDLSAMINPSENTQHTNSSQL
jgi:hypothetical protein